MLVGSYVEEVVRARIKDGKRMPRDNGKALLLGYYGAATKSFGMEGVDGLRGIVGAVGEGTGSWARQPGPVALLGGSRALGPTPASQGEGVGD